MRSFNAGFSIQVSHCTGYFDNPVITSGRKMELFKYFPKHFRAILIQVTGFFQLSMSHLRIILHVPGSKSFCLHAAGFFHSFCNIC